VQDAAKEQIRRKIRRKETAGFFEQGGQVGWRYKAGELYEAGQGWIVVTLIGMYPFLFTKPKALDEETEGKGDFKLREEEGEREINTAVAEEMLNFYRSGNRCQRGIFEYHYRVAI
jgi:hypothetical protein